MTTPAGWYDDPQNPGQKRYWDGTEWTDQRQPDLPGAPAPTVVVVPAQQSHTARNIILAVIGVFILLAGGCTVALVVAGGSAVNTAIDEIEKSDNAPGGPDNPLEIEVGEAFEVQGFNYDAGWSITKDFINDLDIKGLVLTNNRDEADSAWVEIRFTKGNTLVAVADCTTPEIEPGQTVKVDCSSLDKFPNSYDKVTVQDVF